MKKTFFIPLLLGLSMIIASLFLVSKNIQQFLDIPTFAITIGLSFIVMLSQYSFSEIGRAFKFAFENAEYDEIEIKKGIRFFKTFKNLLVASTVTATFIGFIAIFSNEKLYAKIGAASAVCILAVLYIAIMITFIVIPFQSALEKRLVSAKEKN